jgi:nicotinamidase-related amidase
MMPGTSWPMSRRTLSGRIFMKLNLIAATAVAAVMTAALVPCAQAANIIDEWASVTAPPAPALKPVTVDAKTTALLLLDFINPNCTNRPRCMTNLPVMKKLLTEARANGVMVVYSVAGKATSGADVLPDIAPLPGDPVVKSGVDKFVGTDLEKMLKDKGINTVIVNGTGAHGAVLYTASAAAVRGFNVIAPVDGMTSENLYFEQVTAWLLANGTGGIGQNVTLTRSDMIKF